MPWARHIPNLITLANLLCGVLAIIRILTERDFEGAALLVLLALLLDFFDGFAARLLGVSGELGKQLDSLADMVTFGVVPALAIHVFLITRTEGQLAWDLYSALNYFPLLIALFSAYRLAKFNIDTRQSDAFIGLPTPANAIFWMAIPAVFVALPEWSFLGAPWFLIGGSALFSWLLIAPVRLIALKFRSFRFRGNEPRYALIALSALTVAAVLITGNSIFIAGPLCILLYLIISILSLILSPREVQSRN